MKKVSENDNEVDSGEEEHSGDPSSAREFGQDHTQNRKKRTNNQTMQNSSGSMRVFIVVLIVMGITIGLLIHGLVKQKQKTENLTEKIMDKEKNLTHLHHILQDYMLNYPHVVINVSYVAIDYLPLPINPLRKNWEDKGIDWILYKNVDVRQKRLDFIEERINYIDANSSNPHLYLAKYNVISSQEMLREAIEENQLDWQRLEAKFQLTKAKGELPMCILVPGYNNNARFRIQYNLNSIFTQNYTNYKVVIINDASTDGSDETYQKYFNHHAINKTRYVYVENIKRVTALENFYLSSITHCSNDSIVLTLDADDQFIGRNVLQVFNWAYQIKKAGVVYSNYYEYQQPNFVKAGFTKQYTDQQKQQNLYRKTPMRFSQLRSYRAELMQLVNPKDLKDDNGNYFTITYDQALFFPVMELACGRVFKIDGEIHYLYNVGTGLGDWLRRPQQLAVEKILRARKKYECSKQFEDRMKKQ